jgi:protein phosphatase
MWMVCGKTHIGLVRKENQDNLLVSAEFGLFAVADGMGGHAGGREASLMAIESLRTFLDQKEKKGLNHLKSVIMDANDKIMARSKRDHMEGMGTTLTVAWQQDDMIYVFHLGDSRVYLLYGDEIRLLTKDHSLVNELLEQGGITQEEADNYPRKNVLTKALGSMYGQEPERFDAPAAPLDFLLLCTDGLHQLVTEEEMKHIACRRSVSLEARVDALIQLALDRGGHDNITAILAENV